MKKLLLLFATLTLASTSHAYYQAEQGRWINRDPIGELGYQQLRGDSNLVTSSQMLRARLRAYLASEMTWLNERLQSFDSDRYNSFDELLNELSKDLARSERGLKLLGKVENRFSKNLSGIFDDQHLYAFCANNPINRVDYLGLWFGVDDAFTGPIDEIIVLGALSAAAALGIPGAQDALDKLGDALQDLASKAKEKCTEAKKKLKSPKKNPPYNPKPQPPPGPFVPDPTFPPIPGSPWDFPPGTGGPQY